MPTKPFLKWAGGKRWLVTRDEFDLPEFSGRYIEPFLGGAAVFFHFAPQNAYLSDSNIRLIETYRALATNWQMVADLLSIHQHKHCREHYYATRNLIPSNTIESAAQFIYLNRACWNGLYRENLNGVFNVPIGTKDTIIFPDDDFEQISDILQGTTLTCCDFEESVDMAGEGDFLFVDPPYTTAHNHNGFVKYNQRIFSWLDQIRLSQSLKRAAMRGCKIIVTNAAHQSVTDLYEDCSDIVTISRPSVISGKTAGRRDTSEIIIRMGFT